jgi:hypothetical protein
VAPVPWEEVKRQGKKNEQLAARDSMEKYPEEDYARALDAQLSQELALRLPGTIAFVSGAGVHWNCRAEREQRAFTVFCFNAPVEVAGPEFLVRFEEKQAIPLWGRSWEQTEIVAAACAWLEGRSVQALYAKFAFVEQQRRALEKIEQETIASQPQLAALPNRKMVPFAGSDGCTLWFRTDDRSSEVSGADANFYWDECLQFSVQTEDSILLARLLKRWLCDNAMPSALQQEFPSVAMSNVAHFYEQSRGIEGEFLNSWCHVEEFYQGIPRPFALQVLNLIRQLRGAGYERTLRAGTSLFSLLVSRSRRHGLRPDQPCIVFSFGDAPFTGGMIAAGEMEVATWLDDRERKIAFPSIEWSENLNTLLKQLEGKTID